MFVLALETRSVIQVYEHRVTTMSLVRDGFGATKEKNRMALACTVPLAVFAPVCIRSSIAILVRSLADGEVLTLILVDVPDEVSGGCSMTSSRSD